MALSFRDDLRQPHESSRDCRSVVHAGKRDDCADIGQTSVKITDIHGSLSERPCDIDSLPSSGKEDKLLPTVIRAIPQIDAPCYVTRRGPISCRRRHVRTCRERGK